MDRIKSIDRLKGFAILLVIIGHLLTDDGGVLYPIINAFHMPLFMFLSGIVIKGPLSIKKLQKKLLFLLCPFFVVGFIFALYRSIPLLDFLYSNKKCGYWYLFVLSVFYIFVFVYNSFGKNIVLKDIFFIIFSYCLFNVGCRIIPNNLANLISLPACYQNFPFFMLGYIFRKYDLLNLFIRYKIDNIIYSISLLLFIPSMYIYIRYNHLYILEASLVIFILYYLFRNRESSTSYVENILGFFGKYSLDIYIYHYFLVCNFSLRTINLSLEKTNNFIIELMLNLFFACIIALISIIIGKIIRKSIPLSKLVYGGRY